MFARCFQWHAKDRREAQEYLSSPNAVEFATAAVMPIADSVDSLMHLAAALVAEGCEAVVGSAPWVFLFGGPIAYAMGL
jgi:hypothetical protein